MVKAGKGHDVINRGNTHAETSSFWMILHIGGFAAWPAWSAAASSVGVGPAQGGAELGDLPLGHPGRQDRLRPVEGAGPLVQFDRHTRLQQVLRVADGFVAVRVNLRAGDAGGGQAGQIVGPPGRRTARQARSPGSAATMR